MKKFLMMSLLFVGCQQSKIEVKPYHFVLEYKDGRQDSVISVFRCCHNLSIVRDYGEYLYLNDSVLKDIKYIEENLEKK